MKWFKKWLLKWFCRLALDPTPLKHEDHADTRYMK